MRWQALRLLSSLVTHRALAMGGALAVVTMAGTARVSGADIELGRYLATECMTCHGAARADGAIPNIFSIGETHFVEVIKAYRMKMLPNPVMQSAAARLNDEEIAALAAFFQTARN